MAEPLYLNHAGTSWPKPDAVRRAVAAALEAGIDDHPALLVGARADVCRALGIEPPERFVFTPGCTQALATALLSLPLSAGDTVLTSALEHHALVRPLGLLARWGVGVEVMPYAPSGVVDLDSVERRLARGDVRWLAVSVASNVTGEVLPVAALRVLTREHGAGLLLDAAQSTAVLPEPVGRMGADILAIAGHKGPQGPQGVGGLWSAPGVGFAGPAAECAVDAPASAAASGAGDSSHGPDYCDVGGANLAGACGVAAGLGWLARRGPDPFAAARHARSALRSELLGRPGCRVLGGDGPHTAALSLVLDSVAVSEAEHRLRELGLVVRAGRHCADQALTALGAPGGSVRISFGPETRESDVETVLAALASLERAA